MPKQTNLDKYLKFKRSTKSKVLKEDPIKSDIINHDKNINEWNIHKKRPPLIKKKTFDHVVPPFPDELLTSWLVRISIANFASLVKIIKKMNIKPYLFDYDVEINEKLIDFFSEKSGVPKSKLYQLSLLEEKNSYHEFLNQQVNIMKVIRSLIFTSWNELGKNGLRFCPLCLKEDKIPYIRKKWRYMYHTFCPIHNCFMENKCPKCNSPVILHRIKWNSNLTFCHKCGFDLTSIEPKKIIQIDEIHQTYQNFLKEGNFTMPEVYLLITNAWFLANFCDISDNFYNRHPITSQSEIRELWRKYGKGVGKLVYFANVELSYLYFLKSLQFLYLKDLLIPFYKVYYRNSKLFHQSGVFICAYLIRPCDFQTENFGIFLYHLNSHSKVKKEFKNKKLILTGNTKNILQWIDENAFTCEECGRKFKFESKLNAHLKNHNKSDKYKCKFCTKEFLIRDEFIMHCHNDHAEKYKYICHEDGLAFVYKISLIKHNRAFHYEIKDPE